MALKFFKVNALPQNLDGNALYFVKSATTGMMEIYMANEAGTAARKVTGEAEVSAAIAAALAAYDAQGATKLKEEFELALTGDATGSVQVDGSGDVSMAVELKDVGTAGVQGPVVTTDAKGRVVSSRNLQASDLPEQINSNTSGKAATAGRADEAEVADKVAHALTINGTAFDGSEVVSLNLVAADQAGVAGGFATLNESGLIPSEQLPSYVDDVIEADDFASLPTAGEKDKIYVTIDNGNIYRWSGSAYIRINDAVSTADTADTLAVARNIALNGDATGSASFNGSADANIAVTLKDVGTSGEQGAVVTTDAKGRVVSSRALALGDLPAGITATGIDLAGAAEW